MTQVQAEKVNELKERGCQLITQPAVGGEIKLKCPIKNKILIVASNGTVTEVQNQGMS